MAASTSHNVLDSELRKASDAPCSRDEKRIELYREFQQILSDEQPYTFLFVNKSVVAVQRRIRGIEVFPGGIRPIDWWVPESARRYGLEPTLN